MSLKRVPVSELKLGMYIASLDRSWLSTPFFRHHFLLESESQLDKLKRSGITEVMIDPARGLDTDSPDKPAARPTSAAAEPAPRTGAPKNREALAREYSSAQKARQEMLRSVQTVFETIGSAEQIQNEQVKQVVHDIVIISETLDNPAAFSALARTRQFDPALHDHALAVCTLALVLGRSLGYDEEQLSNLSTGALLHDIGLLRLPHHLVRLSENLSKHERALYESHPRLGATSLERGGGFPRDVIRIIAEHHATPDGHGFPPETNGKWAQENCKIVMVVDRYDELVTGQVGVAPLPPYQALSQLYQDGQNNRLDPNLVSQFIKLMGVYPVYSLVQLNTGERAIVSSLNPDALHQPVVNVISDAEGRPCDQPICVDLAQQDPDSAPRSIAAALDPEKEHINVDEWLAAASPGTSEESPEPELTPEPESAV